jgi:hypothetical protein
MESVSNSNIPRSMRYGLQSATAIQASTVLARFSSINGTSFTPAGSNQIRIRVSAQGFLDGEKHYLQFTITNATAAMHVDTHAGSFIDRMRIEANGVVVEEINSYGLYNSIQQTYNSDLSKVFKNATQSGSAQLECVNLDSAGTTENGKIIKAEVGALGEEFSSGHSKVFTIQLESGLLKNHHKKALPDGLVELDLILTLAGNNQAVVAASGSAPTWTLSDPALFAPVYRIENADVMAAYRQTVQAGGLMWSGTTAKTYINSVANSAGTKSLQINDRSLSCLGLVTALRDAGVNSVIDKYANGAYGYNDGTGTVTRMKYQINGVNYPQSDIDIVAAADGLNVGRAHEESIKALARDGMPYSEGTVSRHQLKGSVNDVFASATDTASTAVPKGLLAVSLKKFDDAMLRMTGLNTSANSSPNVLEIVHTAFAAGGLEATTFSICEAFFQMSPNGTLSVAV